MDMYLPKFSICQGTVAPNCFKVGLSSSNKSCLICFKGKPLKMAKIVFFYFILKALFVLKIFKFLFRLFGHLGKTASLEKYGQS